MDKRNVPEPMREPDRNPTVTEPAPGEPEHKRTIVTMKRVKLVYAFALVLALCGAFAAKVATENAVGSLQVPLESEYAAPTETATSRDTAELTRAAKVRRNLTDVPDERDETTEEATEPTTENPYAVPYESSYTLPLGTDIQREYSPDAPKYSPTLDDWRTHPGIDFGGDEGAPVRAIARGTVTEVAEDVLYGTVLTVDHGNGVIARYCGLNADALKVGKDSTVEEGTLLGYLGAVPCENKQGAHLHFEISVGGAYADPLEVMGKA